MAIKSIADKVTSFVKKYRYAFLIFAIGLVFMLLPTESGKTETAVASPVNKIEENFEMRLSQILSKVEGAGDVEVILTLSSGEETLYQTDEDCAVDGGNTTNHSDTVTVTDANRNEIGLIKQKIPAVYRGAIIICQGADNPSVRYEIVEAVSKLTGIGANCISVLKMK